jgi:hypothetical protein
MTIGIVVYLSLWGCLYPSFYISSRLQHDPNQDSISNCLFYILFYRYNYPRLGEHAMVLYNLLDGGPSHSRPLLTLSEYM